MRPLILIALLAPLCTGASDQTPFDVPSGANRRPPISFVSAEEWDALNNSVSGRLALGEPFSKPCFPRFEGEVNPVDSKSCSFIRNSYINETVRTSHPGAQINTQWETCQAMQDTCLLDHRDPWDSTAINHPNGCRLGSISPYYIDVHEPSDVSAAFSFVRLRKIPLAIKNTGHDYKGRSTSPSSLGLWTHNLKQMTYSKNFMPAGCSSSSAIKSQPAVTLGAGVRWFEAYAFAQENDITLVGGADPTVGSTGGWLQGGGHGGLSNTLGMGVDRVLEYVAVTPDGVVRTVNACQNQDLFFALRGGGGGTFAVVLEATTLASPRVTIQATLVQFPLPDPSDTTRTRQLWKILVDNGLKWAQEGWGAYVNANSALYLNPVLDKAAANASMAPLFEFGKKLEKEHGVVFQGEWDSWAHFYDTFAHSNSADLGMPLAIASRLIPASSFETSDSREELLDALIAAQKEAPGVRLLKTTPFNYPGVPGTTAINPAWRTSVFHVTIVSTWNWNATLREVEEKYAITSKATDNLRRITPAAAYVNEADIHEEDFENTFWAHHYSRLLSIKNKYDPERLLDCWHCVGWTPNSQRFSCYI